MMSCLLVQELNDKPLSESYSEQNPKSITLTNRDLKGSRPYKKV